MDLRMLSYPFAILEENGTPCEFALDDIYYDGGEATGIGREDIAAAGWALRPNTPNPFNPSTTITFDVPEVGGQVTIDVFDISGRFVTRLAEKNYPPGVVSVTWDGSDARGARVATGVYFCRMTAPGFSQTRKMVLLK
jgi:hypothetical protein